ncbi:MAG: preprotein translocase subunit SecE, partial [Desulfobacterales bacterium]|nr:preprotein translocase subunit SecE [Desulfobacterales bacterium]
GIGSVLKYITVAGQFLRESRTELKKVKWPTRKELLASTAAVIVLVLVVSLYLGLIDFGLIKIIRSIVG